MSNMSTKPYEIDSYDTPAGREIWLVDDDRRAVAKLIPAHPKAKEISALLSASPLLRAALHQLVSRHLRRHPDSNDFLPEAEQPAELSEAIAALRAASPPGAFTFGPKTAADEATPGSRVPARLRTLVDELGPLWASLPAGMPKLEACEALLKQRGAKATLIWHSGGGFMHALGVFEEGGYPWVVWTGIDACGVEPCSGYTEEAIVESFGQTLDNPENSPNAYLWEKPETSETHDEEA
jgi:hypothetical protein